MTYDDTMMAIQYMKMMDNKENREGDSNQAGLEKMICKNWGAQAHPGSQAVSRGSVEVGSYLEFSVNPKLGSSIWAGNAKDTCAVFDC